MYLRCDRQPERSPGIPVGFLEEMTRSGYCQQASRYSGTFVALVAKADFPPLNGWTNTPLRTVVDGRIKVYQLWAYKSVPP